MFEDEVSNLTPYEVYMIAVSNLKDNYISAFGTYKRGVMEVKCKNTKNPNYYLEKVAIYSKYLKRDYEVAKIFKADVDENSLTESQQEVFHSDDDLYPKTEELLKDMESFLSEYNVDLTI